MKKIILIIGILVGILIGSKVYGQNEVYEEVSEILYNETGLNVSPDYLLNNSKKIKYDPIKEGSISEKIVDLILSFNEDKSEKNIEYVINELHNLGMTSYNYSPQFFNDIKTFKWDLFIEGQHKSSDTQDPETGEYWRKDYYSLWFNVSGEWFHPDGYIINEKQVLWITINKGRFHDLLYTKP
tara:strand:- start:1052 stop:1600 length:549 start_codon:yes stop_codon:yes gene_type:complete